MRATKCTLTFVQDPVLNELILTEVYEGLNMSQTLRRREEAEISVGNQQLGSTENRRISS